MSSKPLISPCRNLYEEDFVAWTEQTARLLRSGRLAELDVDNLTEEVEDMGKSRRQELHSRLKTLLWHLLKWKYQPAKRSTSWQLTIDEQRQKLEYVLEESPSLRPTVPKAILKAYPRAVRAAGLTADTFPESCPISDEQILDENFLPE